ncbi:GLUG domain protein [Treponema primitia ZAS-2]|uniref:GLUG domain protein n=1 Tax=Treponema primitia (strain ATCC BAA-887 / DSM 12427 / ZAS-2) TaxID=545694 RepID=F5YI06_TREPZ|nr:hypothetical protein [Treponema primitia]AEF83722.1 GLUG domain protein [Treponema primitia ZAS-2]
MKNLCRFIVMTLMVALVAISCDLPAAPESARKEPPIEKGKGRITIILSGTAIAPETAGRAASRAVAWAGDPTIPLYYKLTFTHIGDADHPAIGSYTRTLGAVSSETVTLEEGPWSITAAAYLNDTYALSDLVGNSTTPKLVTIVQGENPAASIPMTVDYDYEAGLGTYFIHNEAELRRIGAATNGLLMAQTKTYRLVNDITLTAPWTPLGDGTTPFGAKFYGTTDGTSSVKHSITFSNATAGGFTSYDGQYLGFFGRTSTAEIHDLTLVYPEGALGTKTTAKALGFNPSAITTQYVGGLVGLAENTTIEGVIVSGVINVSNANTSNNISALNVGGVVGEQQVSAAPKTLSKSAFSGDISGKLVGTSTFVLNVGGIAGGLISSGGVLSTVSASFASGAVRADGVGTGWGIANAGGIVGLAQGTANDPIENCYVSADIRAFGYAETRAGGIAGNSSQAISNTYARGTVIANGDAGGVPYRNYAGGIAGYISGGTVDYSVALQTTIGDDHPTGSNVTANIRAIVGLDSGATGFVTTGAYNYAASDISFFRLAGTADIYKDGYPTYVRTGFETETNKNNYFTVAAPTPVSPDGALTVAPWDFTTTTGDWQYLGTAYLYPVLSWETAAHTLDGILPTGSYGITIEW